MFILICNGRLFVHLALVMVVVQDNSGASKCVFNPIQTFVNVFQIVQEF